MTSTSRRRRALIVACVLATVTLLSAGSLLSTCHGPSMPTEELTRAERVTEGRHEPPRPPEPAPPPVEPPPDPAPEPEAPPQDPEPEEPPTLNVRAIVRDAATGKPVPGLALLAGELDVTTDPDGALRLPPDAIDRLEPTPGGAWRRLPGSGACRDDGVRELWVYSTMRVEGRITAESDLAAVDLRKVELIAFTGLPVPDGTDAPSLSVLGAADIDRIEFPDGIGSNGAFLVTLPRIPGYRLVARVRGWEPASEPLGTETHQRVDLTIRKPSLSVRGVLRDSKGTPLRGALITGYVHREFDLAELDRAAINATGHAYKMRTNPHTKRVKLTFVFMARTNDEGEFAFRPSVKGKLTIMAHAAGGHGPAVVEGRALEDDIDFGDVRAPAGDGRMVRVLRNGVPYRKKIGITDLTRDVQPSFTVNLGPKGEFPHAILEEGHLYAISIPRTLTYRGYLVWDGRDVLDMDVLERRRPKKR